MLTLPVTPQNNSYATFLLKIHKQGPNILKNGEFNNEDNWNVNNFIIETGLTYLWETDGELSQDINDVTLYDELYVFEYEVLSKSGSGYTVILSSAGHSIFTADVALDLTVGKHAVNVYVTSSGNQFNISATGFETGDTLSMDNLSLRRINDVIRLSSKDSMYVGSDLYNKGILFQEYNSTIGDVIKQTDVLIGGGIGNVESFQFSISNFSDYFIDNFSPNFGEPELTAVKVELFVAWSNLSYYSEDELFLINTYYINENSNSNNKMDFLCMEYVDLEQESLPKYKVQTEVDDGVSYFPKADDNAIGQPIPVIYGSFNTWNPVPVYSTNKQVEFILAPALLVNSASLEFVICSHSVKTISWNKHGNTNDTNLVFKYLSSLDTFMMISKRNDIASSYTNSDNTYKFKMMYYVNRLYGDLYARMTQISSGSLQSDVDDAIDKFPATYSTLGYASSTTRILALCIDGKESTAEVGYLGSNAGEILIIMALKSADGSNIDYRVGYFNNSLQTPATYETGVNNGLAAVTETQLLDISGALYCKKDSVLPWTIEEICNLEFFASNRSNTPGRSINFYYGYVKMKNINVTGFVLKRRSHGWMARPTVYGTGAKIKVKIPIFGK